jgi:UMF1 family MFS transporter
LSTSRSDRAGAKSVWSWALYDFANSPFTTLVVTFVYGTYFTQAIAPDAITGTVLWTRAITITALVVAFASPFLGALADRGGYRKAFVLTATLVCVVATALLYPVLPGQVVQALVLFVIANIAFELGVVFYNAFLPDLSTSKNIGRISGWAWGCGFVGGLLALVVALVGLIQPDEPWLGFSTDNGENVRATNLLVAAWFLVFSIPLFVWVREDRSNASPSGAVFRAAVSQLGRTFSEIRKHRQTVRFLLARLIYNDGLVTIFAFGGIYAAETFGFTLEEVLLFGIALNVAAAIGAVAMGYLDDLIGAKRTIMISLVGLIAATVLAMLASDGTWLWVAGIAIGIFTGPNQSASRSLMGRFVPPGMQNEFFGFFAFSGKLTAFIGPFLLGEVTALAGSQRTGVGVVVVLFVIGLALLLWVDEREGAAPREARAHAGVAREAV